MTTIEQVEGILGICAAKNVWLRIDHGKLICGPARNLDESLRKVLSANKPDLIQYLGNGGGSDRAKAVIVDLAAECAVSVEWIRQFVIDEFDLQEIAAGRLDRDCLKAHIEDHKQRQAEWQASKQQQLDKIQLPTSRRAKDAPGQGHDA